MNSPSWESTLDSNYLNTEIIQAPLSPPIWETPLWEGTVLYRNSIFEWLYLFKSSGDRLSRGNVSLCSGWSIPFCWRIHFLLTWEKFVKHSATIFSASIFSTRKQKGSLEDLGEKKEGMSTQGTPIFKLSPVWKSFYSSLKYPNNPVHFWQMLTTAIKCQSSPVSPGARKGDCEPCCPSGKGQWFHFTGKEM